MNSAFQKSKKKELIELLLGISLKTKLQNRFIILLEPLDMMLIHLERTLNLPTLSGNAHQFDATFKQGGEIFLIECKDTREAAKEYLYTFNAKIMDYVDALESEQCLSFRGFFVSTVPVAQSAWRYGLAYEIRIVDPDSPPPEYVIANCSDESLVAAFANMLEKMSELAQKKERGQQAPKILEEYRFLCKRWKDDCK